MKIAEISPVFKKLDNTCKGNYQPVSTLCNLLIFSKALFLVTFLWLCWRQLAFYYYFFIVNSTCSVIVNVKERINKINKGEGEKE